MRILFYAPFQLLRRGNGGKTIFFKTKEYLERVGVEIHLFDPFRCDLRQYDVVHCFGMESVDMWAFAKASGLRLAVTPITWLDAYATWRSRAARWAKRRVRSRIRCPLHPYWWEDCFTYPDVSFVPLDQQADQLERAFGVPSQRIVVARYGVDERFMEGNADSFTKHYGARDFVLCVARFDPNKNQLALVRALKGSGIQLVFIGRPDSAQDEWYYQQCVREADPSTLFIRELEHDSPILASGYAAARVLALPSLRETVGMAGLEAGLAGANVAVTRVGGTREYFGEHASYLDPQSLHSIRNAVVSCYRNGPRPNLALRDHVAKNFLWSKIVEANLAGYRRVVEVQSLLK